MKKLEKSTRPRVETLRYQLWDFGLALRKSPITDPEEPGFHTYEIVDAKLVPEEDVEFRVTQEESLKRMYKAARDPEDEFYFSQDFLYATRIPWPGPTEGTYGATLHEIEKWLAWFGRQVAHDLLDPDDDPEPRRPHIERVVNLPDDFDPKLWEDDEEYDAESAQMILRHFRREALNQIKWDYLELSKFEWRQFERWRFRRWERRVARQKRKRDAIKQKLEDTGMSGADGNETQWPRPDDPWSPPDDWED